MRAWLTPDSPAGALYGHPLFVPDAFIPIVWSHLDELAFEENWEAYGTMSAADAAAAMAQMMEDFRMNTIAPDTYPAMLEIPLFAKVNGNSLTWTSVPSQGTAGYWGYATPAVNIFTDWDVNLAADNYFMQVYYSKGASMGVAHFQIDGVDFGTLDMYQSTTNNNHFGRTSGHVTIVTPGFHTLTMKMATKNASSSNYDARISGLVLVRGT